MRWSRHGAGGHLLEAEDRPGDQAPLLRPRRLPLYLLVDRESSWITLFSDPETDDYQELRAVAFGKPLPLPQPFAFDLDTADFL